MSNLEIEIVEEELELFMVGIIEYDKKVIRKNKRARRKEERKSKG